MYSADGAARDTWPLRGGYFTSRPLYAGTAGRVYTQIWGTTRDNERYTALRRFAPDGTPGDSIMIPEWDFGRDGRIWVQLRQPGYLAEPADPRDPGSADH